MKPDVNLCPSAHRVLNIVRLDSCIFKNLLNAARDNGRVVGECLRDLRHDITASFVLGRFGQHPGEGRVDWDYNGPALRVLLRLVGLYGDKAANEIHASPIETATVAQSEARIDADGEE